MKYMRSKLRYMEPKLRHMRPKWRYIGRFGTHPSAICTALPTFSSMSGPSATRGTYFRAG